MSDLNSSQFVFSTHCRLERFSCLLDATLIFCQTHLPTVSLLFQSLKMFLVRNVYNDFGLVALYRGVEAGLVGTIVGGFGAYYAEKYLDAHYPDVGGKNEDTDKKDEELDNYASFRVHLRHAIRRTISSSIGVTITHPFTGYFLFFKN